MRVNHQSTLLSVFLSLAGAACLLAAGGVTAVCAQSSVEKSETSQQAKQPENELDLARAAVSKPSDKPAPPETGRVVGNYTVTSSLEVGYRFEDTGGNRDRYLSDVNVRDGFRVLEYSFDSRSVNGPGALYDSLRADLNNAGGDQSQYYSLRMDKRRVYRFDSHVRRFNYFRVPGPTFALGFRNHDLRQQISDYNLKLFPQRAVRLNFGYGRSMAKGRYNPTYSYERDLFQLLGESRWAAHDYRAGVDATWRGWDFGVESAYRNFRNDPDITSWPGVNPGANLGTPVPPGAISFLERDVPLRSRAVVTRASVRGSVAERFHVVLRALHDDERMRAPYLETSRGTASNNATILSRVLTAEGVVERPNNVVDAGVTFDITKNISLGNTFRYTSFKIQGDVETLQTSVLRLTSGAQQTAVVRTLGVDRLTDLTSFWNTLELNLNFGRKFAANLGWRAMQREVTLSGVYRTPTSAPSATNPLVQDEGESVATHAFVGGARLRPTDRTSFYFDVERGTSNNAFVRISPVEFTRFRVRSQVQATRTLSFTGTFTSTDRLNPTPQVENESDVRSYTAAANWEPSARLWVNVGYDYHDLFSTANIRYFLAGSQLRTGRLLAYGRMNSVFANARFGLTDRLDLLMVYYYIQDRGAPSVTLGANDIVTALPLKRHNPELRIAYRFSNHVTGNVSYRHYSYNERLLSVQDYRSNILTVGARFTF
jgi:hypothetical protein